LIIADDSAVVRAILDQNLTKMGGIEIIASVSNGRRVIDAAKGERPDAVVSDIDMPEMDGLEATKILAKTMHIPVILMSEDSSLSVSAKTAGASGFLAKPRVNEYNKAFFDELVETLGKTVQPMPQEGRGERGSHSHPFRGYRVLCIGASTGGPTAVAEVLKGLGHKFPLPILYAQHIEVGADRNLADWLNGICDNLTVRLARDGEEALPGTVYMAPADRHLVIDFVKGNSHPVLRISDEPPERFLRPAVNMLFRSAARLYGKSCLAVLLTGMGRDGAEGCKLIRDYGGWTLVEDESTCAVFGMPAAAIDMGGACEVHPRGEMAGRILDLAGTRGAAV
ncbi:MAG: response regulator, partial [Treponema sp.]|nr:response regulator [Treponema sp.]